MEMDRTTRTILLALTVTVSLGGALFLGGLTAISLLDGGPSDIVILGFFGCALAPVAVARATAPAEHSETTEQGTLLATMTLTVAGVAALAAVPMAIVALFIFMIV